jgi:hypothetical protein
LLRRHALFSDKHAIARKAAPLMERVACMRSLSA